MWCSSFIVMNNFHCTVVSCIMWTKRGKKDLQTGLVLSVPQPRSNPSFIFVHTFHFAFDSHDIQSFGNISRKGNISNTSNSWSSWLGLCELPCWFSLLFFLLSPLRRGGEGLFSMSTYVIAGPFPSCSLCAWQNESSREIAHMKHEAQRLSRGILWSMY